MGNDRTLTVRRLISGLGSKDDAKMRARENARLMRIYLERQAAMRVGLDRNVSDGISRIFEPLPKPDFGDLPIPPRWHSCNRMVEKGKTVIVTRGRIGVSIQYCVCGCMRELDRDGQNRTGWIRETKNSRREAA